MGNGECLGAAATGWRGTLISNRGASAPEPAYRGFDGPGVPRANETAPAPVTADDTLAPTAEPVSCSGNEPRTAPGVGASCQVRASADQPLPTEETVVTS